MGSSSVRVTTRLWALPAHHSGLSSGGFFLGRSVVSNHKGTSYFLGTCGRPITEPEPWRQNQCSQSSMLKGIRLFCSQAWNCIDSRDSSKWKGWTEFWKMSNSIPEENDWETPEWGQNCSPSPCFAGGPMKERPPPYKHGLSINGAELEIPYFNMFMGSLATLYSLWRQNCRRAASTVPRFPSTSRGGVWQKRLWWERSLRLKTAALHTHFLS